MVPISLFANRDFSVVNLVTLVVYAALSGCFFFLAVQLQVTRRLLPVAAGAATVPVSILMLLLSERAGGLAARLGARVMIGTGSVDLRRRRCCCCRRSARDPSFVTDVLPGITVFGLGLCALVAPLTGTVLAAAPDRYAGTAAASTTPSRGPAACLAIAALPLLVGLRGDDYADPAALSPAYRHASYLCAALLLLGGLAAFVGITRGAGRPATNVV